MSTKQNASQNRTDPLLEIKLQPPRLHSDVIQRNGLLTKLDSGLSRKLIVVSAPTGFGKTTLASQWIAQRNFLSAWVALEKNDNDPSRFWTYVVSGIRTIDSSIGKTTLSMLAADSLPAFETLLTPFINDLTRLKETCVLVLEDYHNIESVQIHEGLAFFIQHLPPPLHLVLVTRSDPPLPLAILRARDELVEIEVNDLRFNSHEAEAFLREAARIDISPAALTMLLDQTEGWAAGLRLAALSLQNTGGESPEKFIQNFSGANRHVADYLIREVFAEQPEFIQSFLLQTCFLNRLSGALCDSITGSHDGESVLEQLAKQNLFIVQLQHGSGRIWYRYHPLFADSLQTLARQRLGEAGIQSIFEKASAWFEYQQLLDDAVEMALAAKLFERAIALIEKFVEIYSLNEMRTLTRWIESIPEALTLQHPSVCLMYAQVILFTSDRYAPATAARIEPYLRAAESIWKRAGNEAGVGTVLAMRGMMLIWQGDFQEALDCAHRSLEKMPEDEIFWRGVSLLNSAAGELYSGHILNAQDQILEARALMGASQNIHGVLAASGIMSDALFEQGDMEPCAQLCEQIMVEAVGDDSMLDDQGNARLNLARIAYEQNDFETATIRVEEALDLGKKRSNELLEAQATGQLALIQFAKGETQRAQDELKLLAARLQSPLALQEVRATEALLAIHAGASSDAWINIEHATLFTQKEREAFIRARQKIAEGKSAEALALVQPYLEGAIATGRVRSQTEALCIKALALHAESDLTHATESLAEAFALGHEKGFRRLFLDEGSRMVKLIQETLPSLSDRNLSLYATTLLHSFDPALTAQDTSTLVEPLSQQEIRVLRLLVAGLSNANIAQELVVSTNTVKTHVKSIYRKLNITSREEAREMAKGLKLL